jgi:hypothetical protein
MLVSKRRRYYPIDGVEIDVYRRLIGTMKIIGVTL